MADQHLKATGTYEDDPLHPPIPQRQNEIKPLLRPEGVDHRVDTTDPVRELAHYVNHYWFQPLFPVRTRCYRCHVDSPMVFLPLGVVAFDDPRLVRRLRFRNETDITKETIEAFAKLGWKFQLRKSYCPACKGLGSM